MADELERGKRTIRTYLSEISDMSTLNNRRIFKIIVDEFENRMEDEEYFNMVAEFLNRRKPKQEKDEFCFNLVKDIVNSIDVKAIYLSKYPDAFKVEETSEEIESEEETTKEEAPEEITDETIDFYINNF